MVPRADAVPAAAPPPRLAFLDGLRGAAALYVTLHHAALMVPPAGLGGAAAAARFVFRHGHYAVPVFIALSGFSLMLGAVASPGGGLPGGWRAYAVRRSRRILPPYYAALALCWLLTATVPALGRPARTPWDRALPAFEPGVVAAHLLLVQNLDGRWFYRVAPPFWTLATEWQCYLLFPVLLAVSRRFGAATAAAAGFAVGAAVALLSAPLGNPALVALCPWYAGLFATGMAGAVASRGHRPVARGRAVAAVVVSTAAVALAAVRSGGGYLMAGDVTVGAATVWLVVRWARAEGAPARPPLSRLLGTRGAVALGACSYSLYLTHYPLLALANVALRDAGVGSGPRLWALLLVASPACVAAAAAWSRVFEVGGWGRGGRATTRAGRPPGSRARRGAVVTPGLRGERAARA